MKRARSVVFERGGGLIQKFLTSKGKKKFKSQIIKILMGVGGGEVVTYL